MKLEMSWFEGLGYQAAGNFYGYHTAATKTRAALEAEGMTWNPRSRIHFSYVAPHIYQAFPNKINVLYSMYETPDAVPNILERVRQADIIIVPSKFCQQFFQKWTGKRVEVVPLGTNFIPYVDRKPLIDKAEKFRFLWTGAFNARKGWYNLAAVWDHFFKEIDFIELYLKTTSYGEDLQKVFHKSKNAIVDGRTFTDAEMVQLYQSAHCFVMPTMGEGWGLTSAEAMSSGCPTILPEYSGMLEYANKRNCFFTPHKLARIDASMGGPSGTNPDKLYQFAMCDLGELGRTMALVMHDYNNALVVGKKAHKDMQAFTWKRTAEGICKIVRDL